MNPLRSAVTSGVPETVAKLAEIRRTDEIIAKLFGTLGIVVLLEAIGRTIYIEREKEIQTRVKDDTEKIIDKETGGKLSLLQIKINEAFCDPIFAGACLELLGEHHLSGKKGEYAYTYSTLNYLLQFLERYLETKKVKEVVTKFESADSISAELIDLGVDPEILSDSAKLDISGGFKVEQQKVLKWEIIKYNKEKFNAFFMDVFKRYINRLKAESRAVHKDGFNLSEISEDDMTRVDIPLLLIDSSASYEPGEEDERFNNKSWRLVSIILKSNTLKSQESKGHLMVINSPDVISKLSGDFIYFLNRKFPGVLHNESLLRISDDKFDASIGEDKLRALVTEHPERCISKFGGLAYDKFSEVLEVIFNPNFPDGLDLTPLIDAYFSDESWAESANFYYIRIFLESSSSDIALSCLVEKITEITDNRTLSKTIERLDIAAWPEECNGVPFEVYVKPILTRVKRCKSYDIANLNKIFNRLGVTVFAEFFMGIIPHDFDRDRTVNGENIDMASEAYTRFTSLFNTIFANSSDIKDLIKGLQDSSTEYRSLIIYLQRAQELKDGVCAFRDCNGATNMHRAHDSALGHFTAISPRRIINEYIKCRTGSDNKTLAGLDNRALVCFGLPEIKANLHKIDKQKILLLLAEYTKIGDIPELLLIHCVDLGYIGIREMSITELAYFDKTAEIFDVHGVLSVPITKADFDHLLGLIKLTDDEDISEIGGPLGRTLVANWGKFGD